MSLIRVATLCTLFAAVGATSAPHTAAAGDWTIKERGDHTRPINVDVEAVFNFFSGISVGAAGWFGYPIVPDGFISSINDSFHIEGGLIFTWNRFGGITFTRTGGFVGQCAQTWLNLTPMAGVRWDFHLTDSWEVFAKAKMGANINFAEGNSCTNASFATLFSVASFAADFGVGAYWHLSNTMAIRMEIGSEGLMGGIGFKFF